MAAGSAGEIDRPASARREGVAQPRLKRVATQLLSAVIAFGERIKMARWAHAYAECTIAPATAGGASGRSLSNVLMVARVRRILGS